MDSNFDRAVKTAKSELWKKVESGNLGQFKKTVETLFPIIIEDPHRFSCFCEDGCYNGPDRYEYNDWLKEEGTKALEYVKKHQYKGLTKYLSEQFNTVE